MKSEGVDVRVVDECTHGLIHHSFPSNDVNIKASYIKLKYLNFTAVLKMILQNNLKTKCVHMSSADCVTYVLSEL